MLSLFFFVFLFTFFLFLFIPFVFLMFLFLMLMLIFFVLIFLDFLPLSFAPFWIHWIISFLLSLTAYNGQVWERLFFLSLFGLLLQRFPFIPSWRNTAPVSDSFIKVSFNNVFAGVVWNSDFLIGYCSRFFGRPFPKLMAALLEHFIEHTHGCGIRWKMTRKKMMVYLFSSILFDLLHFVVTIILLILIVNRAFLYIASKKDMNFYENICKKMLNLT